VSSRPSQSGSNDAPIREAGKFAYGGLERVIHERARLSILSSLSAHPQGLLFNDLKSLCDLTDGNLSRQLQALKEAEMVEVWKGMKNRRPQTMCRLTELGRKRFLEYIAELERVVGDALAAQGQHNATTKLTGRLNIAGT
jgi:DNA-binding transcriptional ArsR family regulator